MRCIGFFQLFQWRQVGEVDPAVDRVKHAAKSHIEVLDCELPVVVFAVHLQPARSADVPIIDCPDRCQFIGSRSPKQVAPQWVWLYQGAIRHELTRQRQGLAAADERPLEHREILALAPQPPATRGRPPLSPKRRCSDHRHAPQPGHEHPAAGWALIDHRGLGCPCP